MSLAADAPLSPSLPDAIMQVSTEPEQNQRVSVRYLNRFPLTFAEVPWIQESGLGFFAYAHNTLITGGTFIVSLSCAV